MLRRLFASKKLKLTLISAMIGAVTAVLFIPISQTISFVLNEYLSRPILSIEYIELIPEKNVDVKLLNSIIHSDEFNKQCLAKNMQNAMTLSSINLSKETYSSEEFLKLNEVLVNLNKEIEERRIFLKNLQNSIKNTNSEEKINSIFTKYYGATFQSSLIQGDLHFKVMTLVTVIETDKDELKQLNSQISTAIDEVKNLSVQPINTLKLKLSILNRGNTDGLIRNIAYLKLNNITASLIKISSPVEIPPSAAVPVTVMNPSEEAPRTTAVGKVEKKAMTDIWYALNKNSFKNSDLEIFFNNFNDHKEIKYRIVLFDQKSDSISADASFFIKN